MSVLVLDELAFGFDGFFILGLGLVVVHVVSEDTDQDGDVDDGEEHPGDYTLVKEKVRHRVVSPLFVYNFDLFIRFILVETCVDV